MLYIYATLRFVVVKHVSLYILNLWNIVLCICDTMCCVRVNHCLIGTHCVLCILVYFVQCASCIYEVLCICKYCIYDAVCCVVVQQCACGNHCVLCIILYLWSIAYAWIIVLCIYEALCCVFVKHCVCVSYAFANHCVVHVWILMYMWDIG